MAALVASSSTVQPIGLRDVSNFVSKHKGKLIVAATVIAAATGVVYGVKRASAKAELRNRELEKLKIQREKETEILQRKKEKEYRDKDNAHLIALPIGLAIFGFPMIGAIAITDALILSEFAHLSILYGTLITTSIAGFKVGKMAEKAYMNYKSQEPF